jgi:prepilin-type N-terminal cleavage/methylation domain-containing protein
MQMSSSKSREQFTLIELLVVITIIAILAAMLLPSLARARERGYMAACLGHLHQMVLTTNMYGQDHDDRVPGSTWASYGDHKGWLYEKGKKDLSDPEGTLATGVFYEYLTDIELFHCPNHKDRDHGTQRLTSYIMHGRMQDYGRGPWFKMEQFPGDFVYMWEANDSVKGGWWNDGTDFAREGGPTWDFRRLTQRHLQRAGVATIGGSAEFTDDAEFHQWMITPGDRVAFCPVHPTDR